MGVILGVIGFSRQGFFMFPIMLILALGQQ